MNERVLSKRLDRVAQYVNWLQPELKPVILADIGSDHAYLPIYLLQKQIVYKAIASEVVKGPYDSAVANVNSAGLTPNQLEVRFGDGLSVISPRDQVNLVTICGMGGQLITRILNEGFHLLKPRHSLVLQPNIGEPNLRKWLNQHQYYIVAEDIIHEAGHSYEIIVAQHRPDSKPQYLSKADCLFGPYLKINPSTTFLDKWQNQLMNRIHLIDLMNQAKQPDVKKIKELETEVSLIKEVLINNERIEG